MLRPSSNAAERSDPDATGRDGVVLEAGIAVEVRDVLAHLKRRRLWIALAALAMAGVGAVVAGLVPRLYTSTAQITVDPRGLRVFDNEVVPGGQLSDVQSALVETQSRVLKSDSVLRPVLEQEHLAEDPDFNGSPRTAVASVLQAIRHHLLRSPPVDRAAIALAALGDAVKVQRVPSSFVIELSVAARDADKAARLAHAITETFIANAQQSRENSAKKVSDELAMRLDALGAEVKRAETEVDTFKRQNNIVDTNGRPINEQQLGDLTNRFVAARAHSDELRARLEQIQRIQRAGAVPDATSEVIQSPAIQQLRTHYAEVKQLQDNLLSSLGPRHPSLLAATAQLAGVKQLIAQEIGRIASSARSDYERAKATEAGLDRQVAATTRETGTVNTATIRLRQLEREAQARRAVYESFLTRSRETREQSDLPTVNISVISPAAVPLKPGGLPALLVIAIVAAFGASAAALIILGLDHLNGRVVTPRQMSLATGLPLLARARRRPGPTATTAQPGLLAIHRALDDVVPARPPRVVLFLSGTSAAAQARIPLDLAYAVAESGSRLLLIDADGDRLTRPFDDGSGSERRSWNPVKRTAVPNLSVLAWSAPLTQSLSATSEGLLLKLAADHDLVFVHGCTDGESGGVRRLCHAATNIVLLVDADAASISAVDRIRREVGPFAAKVEGFVWITAERAGDPWVRPRVAGSQPASLRASDVPLGSARTDAA